MTSWRRPQTGGKRWPLRHLLFELWSWACALWPSCCFETTSEGWTYVHLLYTVYCDPQTPPTSHSPAPVDEFHWLHCECSGNNVIGIVPPPAHHDEPVHLACDEDEAAGANEAQQASPHEGVLTDQPSAGAHRVNLQRTLQHYSIFLFWLLVFGFMSSLRLTSKVFLVMPVRP